MCPYMHACLVCLCQHACMGSENLQELVLSFCHMASRDWIRIIRLGSKQPYPLSHPSDPQNSCDTAHLHDDNAHAKYSRVSSRGQSFLT